MHRLILSDPPPGTRLFRAHTPQWASRLTRGAGAATRGGRFNREGVEALYLSLDEVTALRESQQTSPLLPPCTMCSYTVALRDLVDLRQLHHVAKDRVERQLLADPGLSAGVQTCRLGSTPQHQDQARSHGA